MIHAGELQRDRLETERDDLAKAAGGFRNHPVANALRELRTAEANVMRLEANLRSGAFRKAKRVWRADLGEWRPKLTAAAREVGDLTGAELARLDKDESRLGTKPPGSDLPPGPPARADGPARTARHHEAASPRGKRTARGE